MIDVILKRFAQPDETRTFSKGKFDLIHIGSMTLTKNPTVLISK
jgi:catalase